MPNNDWSSWRLFVDILKARIEHDLENSNVIYERRGYRRIVITVRNTDGYLYKISYSLDEIGTLKADITAFALTEAQSIIGQFRRAAKKELTDVRD